MNKESQMTNRKGHMIKALEEDVRYDGRKKDEFREVSIEYDVSNTADGSAKIKCGDTEIIIGISLSLGTPYPDRPDEGSLMVSCELLPIAHPDIESGPPSIDSIEISRVIDRGIRESGAIDVKGLCVEPGEKVWIVSVDVIPINHDGNIIDVGALGAVAAIAKTFIPKIEDGIVNYKEKTDKKLNLIHTPIPITVCKIGEHLLVDPSKEEEQNVDARLTIAVMEDENICSLQKGGDIGFTSEELKVAFDLAVAKSKELRKYLK
ncbi:exosome complex protein Rrp42 [Candidatus Woesearchaeota archaeon]|nr:exosome complex protein Rrp42 [Candidatus Woesearchaeota archaeon]